MSEELPIRKPTRLPNYDYSQSGYYFVTICSKDKKKLFGHIVGDGVYDIPQIRLSPHGMVVDKYIQQMNVQYADIRIDKYVVMPNHIHWIVEVSQPLVCGKNLRGSSQAPNPTNATLPKFISLFKRYCNRDIGYNVFQRSFHDHIIRDKEDYLPYCLTSARQVYHKQPPYR